MADESKNTQTKAAKAKDNFLKRFANWWVRLFQRVISAFKNMWYELKKVTWPTKKKWYVYSVVVLVFILCMSIVIGLLDMGASALIRLLIPS